MKHERRAAANAIWTSFLLAGTALVVLSMPVSATGKTFTCEFNDFGLTYNSGCPGGTAFIPGQNTGPLMLGVDDKIAFRFEDVEHFWATKTGGQVTPCTTQTLSSLVFEKPTLCAQSFRLAFVHPTFNRIYQWCLIPNTTGLLDPSTVTHVDWYSADLIIPVVSPPPSPLTQPNTVWGPFPDGTVISWEISFPEQVTLPGTPPGTPTSAPCTGQNPDNEVKQAGAIVVHSQSEPPTPCPPSWTGAVYSGAPLCIYVCGILSTNLMPACGAGQFPGSGPDPWNPTTGGPGCIGIVSQIIDPQVDHYVRICEEGGDGGSGGPIGPICTGTIDYTPTATNDGTWSEVCTDGNSSCPLYTNDGSWDHDPGDWSVKDFTWNNTAACVPVG